MKIRYFSDLHLEFFSTPQKVKKLCHKIPPADVDEICILAGDIGNPRNQNYHIFMEFIDRSFKKTFVIAGNHEYYGSTIDETNQFMMEFFSAFDNITFLNNSCEIYENYCFIGTTLWSKITNPREEINDVHKIVDFDYIVYNRLNRMAIDFLENTITENSIIISHHVPSFDLIDIKYKTPKMQPYNQWFCCDMNDFITENKNKICAWFYGHTHTPNSTTIENIPFCCNAIGYLGENCATDFGAVLEI